MSLVDLVSVQQAITNGDMDELILLYSKSTLEKQGQELRDYVKDNLKFLKEKIGLMGETFAELVADYDTRKLMELYVNDLPQLLSLLKGTEKKWPGKLLLAKMHQLGRNLAYPLPFKIEDIGELAYQLCLKNTDSRELQITIARLIKNDYEGYDDKYVEGFNGDDKLKFIKLCQENNDEQFLETLYLGCLENMNMNGESSFFHTLFLMPRTEREYEKAADTLFYFFTEHCGEKLSNKMLRDDIHYFTTKLRQRKQRHLLDAFRNTLKKLIDSAEDDCGSRWMLSRLHF